MLNLLKLFKKVSNKYHYDALNINKYAKIYNKTFYSNKVVKEMKYLNVAEKPDAAKNISNILSNGTSRRREGLSVYNKVFDFDCNVKGQNCKMSMTSVSGHLLNYEFLPSYKGWKNCNPEQLFEAPIRKNLSNNDSSEKIKKTLEREVRGCQGLIIWTDCDREGENIGFEIIEVCQAIKSNLKIFRAKFSEITRTAIFRAINNLIQPDKKQNDAVNIRQELDLRTGAALTRYQTLRLQRLFPVTISEKLISYGSCQIPTLGFVAERYKEVEDFVSEPFWKLKVIHTIDDLTVEFNWARNRLFDKEAVEDYLLICLADPKAKVENKTVKPKNKWRPQPMDTVELEKLGSRKLKINAKETMTIAEKLYNKGFISYPRTETNSFSSDVNLRALAEQQIPHSEWGQFASKVLEWGPNPRNGKKTDEAHPPIHPTKFTTELSGNEARIYELIVRHFLACISKDATGSETIVYIDIAGEKFNANGLVIYERNYLDVYPYEKWNAKQIHHYEIGQIFEPTEISMQEGATTAPPLLTEADLITLMEKHGIGTDATHAEHIHRIKERGYIGEVERGLLVPGTIGMGLYEGYGAMDLELAKPRLRAEFESDLKKVCNGEKDPQVLLREQIAKYKEAYHLITQRINAMDEKFGNRVNEVPTNRRNNDDRGPGGGSNNNRNDGNNDDNNSDDGNDDDNPPRGGGRNNPSGNDGFSNQIMRNHYDDGLPEPIQEIFLCPKCKTSKMILKKKNDSDSYFIGCSNYPNCKNAVWLSNSIKEAKMTESYCKTCGIKTNESSLSKKITFKFKNNSYLALLNSQNPTYTTCIRCDYKFREIFDINLDQVKYVGHIVSDSVNIVKSVLKQKSSITTKPKGASKIKIKTDVQNKKLSTNSKTSLKDNVDENIGWVFDEENNDLFENDGFDNELDKILTNLEPSSDLNKINIKFDIKTTTSTENIVSNNVKSKNKIENYFTNWGNSNTDDDFMMDLNAAPDQSTNIKSEGASSSKWVDLENLKNRGEIDAFLTNWGKPKNISNNNEGPSSSSPKWGTSSYQTTVNNSKNSSTSTYNKSSKWTNFNEQNNENNSNNRWFPNNNSLQQPNMKKYKPDETFSNTSKWSTHTNLSENNSKIKCSQCNKIAKKHITKKEGPNQGREFYSCENTCKFFKWADETVQNVNTNQHTEKCSNCNKLAVVRQVRKEGPNQGKSFYTCSSSSCSFFKWVNEELLNVDINSSTNNSWGTKKKKVRNNEVEGSGPKKRKCGLCRLEGHTKSKCPRKEEFE